MNKANIVEKVQEQIGDTKAAAERGGAGIFDAIVDSLKKEEEVSIAGFGIFTVKHRAARQARNPRTGEMVNVPATKVPKFRASKNLKDSVK